MSEEIGSLAVSLSMDAENFNGTISQVNRNIRAMGSELQAVKAQGKEYESSIDGLAQKQDILSRSVDAAGLKLQEQRKRYDELVQSGKATEAQIERAANAVNQAQAQYNRLNTELKNVTSALNDAQNKWKQAGSAIGEFGEKASATGGKLRDMGSGLMASVSAPIVAFGAASLAVATQFDTAQTKIQAQLGVTAQEAERLSEVAQEVWKKGFGEDVVQVTSDLGTLKQYLKDVGDEELSGLLEASYTLQELYGAEIQESARTASVMMKTFGIEGQTAMDLITVGFQRGGDFSGELLDTMREYAPQFKAMGYDAEAFTAVLIAGAEAGAFNLDKVGDAAKESFLRIGDGSKSSRDALEALGLNFQQIENDINSGGETANSAFAAVASAIALVQDPAEKSRLAVALMGTPIEDLGPEFQNFFANVSTELTGFEGAAARAGETLQQSFGERLQSTWRTAQESLLPLGETILNVAEQWLPKISSGIETATNWFNGLSPAAQNTTLVLGGLAAAAGPVIAGVGLITSGIGAVSAAVGPAITWLGGFGAAAGTAGASAGILGGALTALSGPVGWTIAGVAAVGTAAIVVADQMSQSSIQITDWSSQVSASTAEAVGGFLTLSDQATVALNQLAWGGTTVTAEMATNIISIYADMSGQVLTVMQADHAAQLQQMTDHFAQSNALTEAEESQILATIQSKAAEKETIIADGQTRITEILNTAAAENRAITEAEQAEINAIQQTMAENAVQYMTESQAEQKVILETLKSEASAITAEMAAEVVKNSAEQKNQVVAEAEEQYSQAVEAIVRQRDEMGTISAEQADKLIEEAQRQRDETISAAEEMHQNVVSEAQAQADEHVNKVDWETGEVKSKWQIMKDEVLQAAKDIGTGVKNDFSEMYEHTAGRVAEIKESVATKFAEIKQNVETKMTEAKTAIETKWGEAKKFLEGIDLVQIGKDVVAGFVRGIRNTIEDIGTAAAEMGNKAINALSSAIQRKSPARKFIAIGEDTGEGYAIGIEMKQSRVEDAMRSIGEATIAIADEISNEVKEREQKLADDLSKMNEDTYAKTLKIQQKAAKEKRSLTEWELADIQKIESTFHKNKLTTEKKAAEDIKKIQSTVQKDNLSAINAYIANKKSLDELSAREEAAIWEQSLTVFTENTDERVKAQENYNKAVENVRKTDLANIQSFIDSQKALNQWSLADEVIIWQEALDLFGENTDERIKVQQNYQKAVDTINKEVESINKAHSSEMQKILDEDLAKREEYTNRYTTALEKKKAELINFAGIFEKVIVDTGVSGQQLVENLASQVVAMEDWAANLQTLASRGINDGLLAELRALGPKALSEIAALNTLTDEQLQVYEALWQEKSAMATQLAIEELEPLKAETDAKIADLQASTESKLDTLVETWKTQIENVTTSVESGLEPLESIGSSAVEGLIVGLAAKAPALEQKAREIASTISETLRSALDINSPSGEGIEIAEYVGDGIVIGLGNKIGAIVNSATIVAKRMMSSLVVSARDAHNVGASIANNVAAGVSSNASKITQAIKDQVRESMYQDLSGKKQDISNSAAGGITGGGDFGSSPAPTTSSTNTNDVLKEKLDAEKEYIAERKKLNILSLEEELAAYQEFIHGYEEVTEGRVYYERQIAAVKKSIDNELLNSEKEYISERKRLNQMSLMDELAAYQKFVNNYETASDARIYYERQIQSTKKQIYNDLTKATQTYTSKINAVNNKYAQESAAIQSNLASSTSSIMSKLRSDELKATEDYNNKVTQYKRQQHDKELALVEQYQNDLAARTKQKYDEYGLFDQARVGKVAGSRLTLNLESQLKAIEEWRGNMLSLENRDVDKTLVKELQEMGMDAAGQVKALNRMSDDELDKYVSLWREKSKLAKEQATYEMQDAKAEMERNVIALRNETATQLSIYQREWHVTMGDIRSNANAELGRLNSEASMKLSQLRSDTQAQLKQYEKEWSDSISEVRDGTKDEFNAMTEEMPDIGKNVIEGMLEGLAESTPELYAQIKAIADNIKKSIQSTLDFTLPDLSNTNSTTFVPNNSVTAAVADTVNKIRDVLNSTVNKASVNAASAISTARSKSAETTSIANTTSVDQSRTFAPNVTIYSQDSGATEMERTLTRMQYGLI